MQENYSSLFGKIAALEVAVDALIKTHHSGCALRAKFAESSQETRKILEHSGQSPESLASFDLATDRVSVFINNKAEGQGKLSLGRIGTDGSLTNNDSK